MLQAPDLIGRLRAAIRHAGIIGEENNPGCLPGRVSRKLERPWRSSCNRPVLQEDNLDGCVSRSSREERIKYSAMTGQSLYYLGETNLKHKICHREESGRESQLRLEASAVGGELMIASTARPADGPHGDPGIRVRPS